MSAPSGRRLVVVVIGAGAIGTIALPCATVTT
jgi:threonine dehydrogenase-like Zn-dependent dehydrogenase